MSSLKDQLLGLGFKPEPRQVAKPGPKPTPDRTQRKHKLPAGGPVAASKPGGEIDLGKAWALRAASEKREAEAAERARQEAARQRREAKKRLDALLAGKELNDAAAEQVRHFPYGGKIKRVHVTAEQLLELNAGRLGVVQSNGRYLLVSAGLLVEVKALLPEAIALEVDPTAGVEEDDPAHPVPDDLSW